MTTGPLDASILSFIANCINSVEQLEILLLLRQKRSLDVETINRELRTSSTSVEKRLVDLIRKNLVTRLDENGHDIYSYTPSGAVGPVIDNVAVVYTTHRVAIIDAIFSKPSDGIKDFSDAFRLKGKDK